MWSLLSLNLKRVSDTNYLKVSLQRMDWPFQDKCVFFEDMYFMTTLINVLIVYVNARQLAWPHQEKSLEFSHHLTNVKIKLAWNKLFYILVVVCALEYILFSNWGSWSSVIVWGCRKPEPCLQKEVNCLEWFNGIISSSGSHSL